MIGECFDPNAEFAIRETCKPHWSQAGAVVFLTIRTTDSIPRELIERWFALRCDWLRRKGVLATTDRNWQQALERLDSKDRVEFQSRFNRLREDNLDRALGRCQLRSPACARIVADSLLHFDKEKYVMGDFIVMPNHIHLLASFSNAELMKVTCTSWMRFTATQINRITGDAGQLWQSDPFDHLVRSPEQYDYLRTYIADNPIKANLQKGQYLHRVAKT